MQDGYDIDCFHASEDQQAVRNRVFNIIGKHISGLRLDAVIVEKRKAQPEIQW